MKQTRFSPADLVALLTTFIWGVNFVFIKAALDQFDVLAYTGLRYFAMLVLGWTVLLGLAARGGRELSAARAIWTVDRRQLVIASVLGFILYVPISAVGLQYTTASASALFIAVAPLFASVLLWLLRVERIRTGHIVGLLIAAAGSMVFVADAFVGGPTLVGLGDLLSVLGAFFYAAYNVANKPLTTRYPALAVTTIGLTVGATAIIVLSLPALVQQDWSRVTPAGWAALGFSTVFPVYVAWTMWSWATARIGVARTTAYLYLVPLFGAGASGLLLHEEFTPIKLIGGAVMIVGVVTARVLTARLAPARPLLAQGASEAAE